MSNVRGIPGQALMSRLFTRAATRPTIGTSPAFFARFGLEDPWAFNGFGGSPVDSNDPFVFLSAADYYGHMDRLRARQRLMERFRAMEASASAASALGRGRRSRSVDGTFRASSLANMALADSVLVAPLADAPEPEAEETASGWVSRRGEKAEKKASRKSVVVRSAEDRPLVRALRQAPADAAAPVWRAVADAGVRVGAAERQVIGRALAGIEALAADEQVEVARQVVRRLKGPQRRLAEVAVEEVASAETETPARVAASRMTARASRKGLRTVLSSSPALIGLRFEDAAPEVAAPADMARRSSPVVSPRSVRARGAHASPVVAAAAGVARTQVAVGRAGPSASFERVSNVVARSRGIEPRRSVVSVGVVGEPRRSATERVGARALAALVASPSEGLERGTAALEAPSGRSVRRGASRRAASILAGSEFVTPAVLEVAAAGVDASEPIARKAGASGSRPPHRSVITSAGALTARSVSGPLGTTPAPYGSRVVDVSASGGGVVEGAGVAVPVGGEVRVAPRTEGLVRIAARSRSAMGPSISAPVAGYVREDASAPLVNERVRTQRSAARTIRPATGAPDAIFARPADVGVASEPASATSVSARVGVARMPALSGASRAAVARRDVEVLAPTGRPTQRAIARTVAPDTSTVAAEPMAHARSTAVVRAMQRQEAAPVRSAISSSAPTSSSAPLDSSSSVEHVAAERSGARRAVGARRSAVVASPGELVTARPSDVPAAAEVESAPVALRKAAVVRQPAAARAVRRAEVAARASGVIAPSPVSYVSAPAHVAVESSADAPVARPSRSVSERMARAGSASGDAVSSSSSTSIVSASSSAVTVPSSVLAERVAARSAVTPVSEDAAVARVAARAEAPSAPVKRVRNDSPEAVLARPAAAEVVEGAPVAASATVRPAAVRTAAVRTSATRAAPAVRSGSTRHAARRMEAFAPPVVSAATVQRSASEVVARRSARRAVGPAMPHVSANDFRIDVDVPLAAVESRVASASGKATGPVTRASLASVLGRVAAVVRAMERSEESVSVSPAIRRALAEAPAEVSGATRVRSSRVASVSGRFERAPSRGATVPFEGVFARPADAAIAPEATGSLAPRVAAVVRPVARAERRAAVTNSPSTRPARRAMAGVSGLTGEALDHIVQRSFAPAAEAGATAVRYRTLRTADGRFAPLAPESVKPLSHRFGTGRVEIPSASNARSFEAASGLVLPRNQVTVDAEESPAPVVGGRRPAAGVRTTVAQRSEPGAQRSEDRTSSSGRAVAARSAATEPALRSSRPARSFSGTLGRLNGAAPVTSRGTADRKQVASDRSVDGPRARRTVYDDAGVLVRAAPAAEVDGQDLVGAPLQTPGYAKRAITGTVAETTGRRPVATHLPPRLSTGSLLTALARADRPEDVVQVILQRGGTLADIEREVPEAAAIVERIARLGGAQAARASTEGVTSGAVEQAPPTQFLSHRSPSASGSRVRRAHSRTAPSDGAGSSQAMKLAQKLMNLIHLAETDRKSEDARRQVRMAEASAEARSEGSASVAAGQTKNLSGANVNIAALQREVLEAVLQALELNHHRRQEDTDVWW